MTDSFEAKLTIFADLEALSISVAGWIFDLATAKEGVFAICLSGGSTPKRLYEHLAAPPFHDTFPWSRTHFFWGDERFVPSSDISSNYRMVKESLLAQVPIPDKNIHPIPTDGISLAAASAAYERDLKSFYGTKRLDSARPIFDVTLLGLGLDGHTASLFPGSPVLAEKTHWVAPVIGPKSGARITLTYPALESSRHVAFLLEGTDKQTIFERFHRGDHDIPAARLSPAGELRVFADRMVVGESYS